MKVKVLLADDEVDFAKTLAERLEMRNLSVTPVFSGKAALEIIEEIDFDVIVLDVLMPETNGIDLLREIKEKTPLTQVIMLTGQATVKNAIEGMKLGAFDFLLKPADIDMLEEKINDAYGIKLRHEERIRKAQIDSIIKERGW
ncbi:Two-component response regulator (CheY-like receiver domain and a winged-helix DNA-binding domain) [Desulfamplus magnetovallimortis]|uniref:Two-component response regulator (CheY-like receiver domain and a winged-helix DNA-binding domain) n=1 Tax=Desulfamplus magnetovallimortis TaxID=1246637 RepID=A0A1W1HFI6_9BACT|nr:response regulator [Desulfamplus magnetovallimortis]SLM31254.1 Two-component response regulator (CheY-like receiver domain and a winged-helix DNA-binding domain) [Desulfamplus magnetovallimortis]